MYLGRFIPFRMGLVTAAHLGAEVKLENLSLLSISFFLFFSIFYFLIY